MKRANPSQKLVEDLAELEAAQLWQQAPEKAGVRVVQCVFDVRRGQEGQTHCPCCRKASRRHRADRGEGDTHRALLFAEPGGRANLSDVMKQTLAKFGGKGGGTRDFAQGGGLPEDQLEAALSFAESLVALKLPGNLGGDFARRVIFPRCHLLHGRVAQLGERGVRNAEVEGSNPFASTKSLPFCLTMLL